jgi:hypothetical protein
MKQHLRNDISTISNARATFARRFAGRFDLSTVQRFNMFSHPLAAVAFSLGLLATTGCQVFTYTSPTGERFTRSSLGANTSIQSLAIEAGTNGVRRVELRGYDNETSQSLGAVTEAAVKAAIESAK